MAHALASAAAADHTWCLLVYSRVVYRTARRSENQLSKLTWLKCRRELRVFIGVLGLVDESVAGVQTHVLNFAGHLHRVPRGQH